MKGDVSPIVCGDVAFEAVERCGDLLTGWELCAYQMHADLDDRARDFVDRIGARYSRLSFTTARDSPHDAMLAMHGRSRVSLALNRSDALSTSFLEAMAMGSFPVHSWTSCGNELAADGFGALFVPPDDVDAVEAALRRALTDDQLVDAARPPNSWAVEEHANRRLVRELVLDAYERIVASAAQVGV
jgi:glycosyltransferase involved in cell wall biosynthesis